MIGKLKMSRGLSMVQFIEAASSAGIDYAGGNPDALSLHDLKDLHRALEEMPPVPF